MKKNAVMKVSLSFIMFDSNYKLIDEEKCNDEG